MSGPLLHEHAVERCDQRLDATRMGVPEPIRRGLVQYACVQSIEIELTERGAGTPRRVESRQSLGEFTVALQGTEWAPYDRKLSVTNCSPGWMRADLAGTSLWLLNCPRRRTFPLSGTCKPAGYAFVGGRQPEPRRG